MEFRYLAADGEQLVLDTKPLHAQRVKMLRGKRFVREINGAALKELQRQQRETKPSPLAPHPSPQSCPPSTI